MVLNELSRPMSEPVRGRYGCFCVVGIFMIMFSFASNISAEDRNLVIDDSELQIQIIEPTLKRHDLEKINLTDAKPPLARVLWLPSEYGVLPQEKLLAKQLANYGVESWFVDFYEALFLAPSPSSVDQIPVDWTKQLLALAKQGGLPLWIIAPNRAAQTAVRGLHAFLQKPQNGLGLILINPNLYLNTPQAGLEAVYWPHVSKLNLPISIIQSELSPWRWRLSTLANQFEQAGSDVFSLLEPNVRDRFYFRPDALEVEQNQAKALANQVVQVMLLQQPYLQTMRQSLVLTDEKPLDIKQTRSTELQLYLGQQNLSLNLLNQLGEKVDLKDYRGKVVLVNFWASWCPPCVYEMPSMSRLKNHFKDQPFEILAVNLGEEKSQIKAFLKDHPVNFPILIDQQGQAIKEWKVFAYPSSYLIDQNGQIQFALFGATEWDLKGHLEKIDGLLREY